MTSGWIHAVYTSEDTMAYTGRWLHSGSLDVQWQIYNFELESKVHVHWNYLEFVNKKVKKFSEDNVNMNRGAEHRGKKAD
ncbi:unnamed protein product [Caenorhabditis brenneri]